MRDIARPALAEVLANLTESEAASGDGWREWWRSVIAPSGRASDARYTSHAMLSTEGVAIIHRIPSVAFDVPFCGPVAWTVDTPREAVEVLHDHGVYPWSPGDPAAPRWWCEFLNDTIIDDPPSLPALVAVASLGVERLRAAEGLTQEIAAHAGCREARLVWRVMGREAIEMHHVRICSDQAWRGGSPTLPEVASVEEAIRIDGGAWPWHAAEDWSDSTARAAWPALRDLHALGLHLVALDASRIVLAVEAIGGDRG